MIRILGPFVLFALMACDQPPPPPQPVTVTVEVGGMHCDGCAMAITEAIEKLDGVKSCAVSFSEKRAEVELDPARVTPAEVASVIAGLGYHATMPGESATPTPPPAVPAIEEAPAAAGAAPTEEPAPAEDDPAAEVPADAPALAEPTSP